MTQQLCLNSKTWPLNILVVDDSKAMLGVISSTINALGFNSCKTISSAKQALQLVKESNKTFHLIFIDLNMPEMDGIELITELSKIQFTGSIVILSELDQKIIDLAGKTSKNRVRLIACLNKPITTDKMTSVLNKYEAIQQLLNKEKDLLSIIQLKEALQKKWLVPYYQPLVNNLSGKVFALEVLSRILIPGQTNAVSAVNFISTAEQYGLIEQLTFKLLEQVIDDYPSIINAFGVECKIAINVSPLLLINEKLPDLLENALKNKGIQSNNIILEITESYAINKTIQFETINRLRIKGFHLGLDDYGTGFTNIQQLKDLPYTEIKIDRSLIFGIHKDKLAQIIAKSLFDVFRELKVHIVAEGVETVEDLNYLNSQTIDLNLQGYIISRPKSLDNIIRWYNNWRKNIKPS